MSSPDLPFRRDAAAAGPASSFDADARTEESPAGLPTCPACPFCEGTDTEIMSAFGAHASVSSYWCRKCGSPFDFMKWPAARPTCAEASEDR
jgi:hypothetical protein